MQYKQTGFRPFYHHFTAVPVNEPLKQLLSHFPGSEDADHLLTYGYIDPEQGLMLEILAPALAEDNQIHFGRGDDSLRLSIPIEKIGDGECLYFADESGNLAKLFAARLDALKIYDASEEVEKTRELTFLDGSRILPHVDNIRVSLVKDGLDPEQCPVRMEGVGEGYIVGSLLDEPQQPFGYHKHDKIAFYVQQQDDRVVCFADLNPSHRFTAEDLADGSMLEAAVSAFSKEPDQEHLLDVLEILRDSQVWVPYISVKRGRKTVLEPDILKNSENQHFFPIFSTQEAMNAYQKRFTRVRKPMLEVVSLARANRKKPGAIVLNEFTESFVLDAPLWTVLEEMKSMLG